MPTIGIDIGTSYSSVCILDGNGQPERVKVATGTSIFGDAYSLPSAVFVEADGRLLLGQSAISSRMRLPENFKSEFKRDLGQPAPYLLGDRQFLPEDLYKEFFIYLKKCVEDYTHESVTEATITCPAVFNRSKKDLIQSAAKKAGLLSIMMLDEPSAAAYCYLHAGKLKEGDSLLVYDLGGGTFDVALLRYANGAFVQLTQPMGIACCGGADFDKLIYDHIMEQIGVERLEPVRASISFFRKFTTQIMETAIKAKHHLSNADVFSDVIPVGFDAVDFVLTRNAYNAMIAPIVDETLHQVRTVLKNAGTQAKEVKTVLLVGGASRTPLVKEMLARVMGKEPLVDIDPELAVCAGAAVYGKAQSEAELRKRKEEARRITEEAQRQKEAEEQRKHKEEEKRRAEEAQRQKEAEEQRKRKEEAKRRAEEAQRQKEAEEQRKRKEEANQPTEARRNQDILEQSRKNQQFQEVKITREAKTADKVLLKCEAKLVPHTSKYALIGALTVTQSNISFNVGTEHNANSETKPFCIELKDVIRVERQPFRAETVEAAVTAMLFLHVAIVKGLAKIPDNKRGVKVIGRQSDYLFGFSDTATADAFARIVNQRYK